MVLVVPSVVVLCLLRRVVGVVGRVALEPGVKVFAGTVVLLRLVVVVGLDHPARYVTSSLGVALNARCFKAYHA